MEFKKDKTYILSFKINEKVLTYTATNVKQDEIFISFIDKFGSIFNLNKNYIFSVKEVLI